MEDGERKLLILVIEDQPKHLQVIEQVLAESSAPCELVTLTQAQQGLDFLYRRGDYQQAKRPDFILLDVHLSDGDGHTVLSKVKSDISLRRIPIIILTHLTDTTDMVASYQQQCNCYVVKPQDLNRLCEVVQAIESFWLNIVTLPVEWALTDICT